MIYNRIVYEIESNFPVYNNGATRIVEMQVAWPIFFITIFITV